MDTTTSVYICAENWIGLYTVANSFFTRFKAIITPKYALEFLWVRQVQMDERSEGIIVNTRMSL